MDAFSPSRLTIARQRRGKSKKWLADQLGLTAAAITGLESGLFSPSVHVQDKLAFILQFPPSFFRGEEFSPLGGDCVSFRSLRSMSAGLRDKMLASGVLTADLVSHFFRQHFELPTTDVPDLSGERPETAARLLREYWKIGRAPIKNMVHLLEAKGIEVYWLNEDENCIDALSFWRDSRPYVLLNSFKEAGERGRFDAAHEIGHLVLHRNRAILGTRDIEAEANQFASAFLMPAEQFQSEAPRTHILQDFLSLKQRWGVSVAAMVRRCRDLGLLSPWQYEQACVAISARGWRRNEAMPLRREASYSHPDMLQRLERKRILRTEIPSVVGLLFNDIAEFVPSIQDLPPSSMPNPASQHAPMSSPLRRLQLLKKVEA